MTEGWAYSGGPPTTSGPTGLVTVLEGSTFCISTAGGNIVAGAPMGLFYRDARVVSEWVLEVNGESLDPLAVSSRDPFRVTFVARARPPVGRADSTLLVVREREVGNVMVETLRVRNLGAETAAVRLSLSVAADFADLFEVKESRVRGHAGISQQVVDGRLELRQTQRGRSRGVRVAQLVEQEGRPARVSVQLTADELVWHIAVPAGVEWSTTLVVEALDGEGDEGPRARRHDVRQEEARAERRAREWRAQAPVLTTPDHWLAHTLERSLEDLGALRIFDPDHPDRAVVAAGAPWFMALFGRDSLLTSWMLLPLDTRLALGTLQALAEAQGSVEDPLTEEQPGRILHETRLGPATVQEPGQHEIYYGSVDSTPLFVMLLGELRRWGRAEDEVDALLPAADRALEWITTYGDRDGDGFVEYQRATDRGLRNQGWKDSFDGITFADGRLAEAPIALCEVQGYAYAAFLARAHFAKERGEGAVAQRWGERAARLKAEFNDRFWLPDLGWYALGLDRDKCPIDSLVSNMGHCLWTGIVDEDKAGQVAEKLLSPEMFTGWGVRTLGRSMNAYNPMSYHNGSVWPHDNAIIAAGLARYGYMDEARRIAEGLLDASERFGGRLPELFCGFDRADFDRPVPYPTSCSPQAWASAAPVLLLRSLLRFDPQVPAGLVSLAPALPPSYLPLRLENVLLAGERTTLEVTHDGFTLDGTGPDITVLHGPRAASTAV